MARQTEASLFPGGMRPYSRTVHYIGMGADNPDGTAMPDKAQAASPCILVVEDDAFVRLHGVDLLEDAGFAVIEAANADEAFEILARAQQVRLLFTDIDMPGSMNGLELAELVHRRWPDIRLLVTSGHHQLSDREIPDAGRFVAKPYQDATILDQVTALLRKTGH